MKKIISLLAFTWAGLMMIVLLGSFMINDTLQGLLMKLPFMKLDPAYSAGIVIDSIASPYYSVYVHEPVFPALFGESKEGFVQVNIKTNNLLPDAINEKIDHDLDGSVDFVLNLNYLTGTVDVESLTKGYWLNNYTKKEDGWIVRVGLCNPNKIAKSCSSCPYYNISE